MKITENEIAMLEACQTGEQWDAACDRIKDARGGAYPPDWFHRVMVTGMMTRITSRFPRR